MGKEDQELVDEGDEMAESIHKRMGLGLHPKFQKEDKHEQEEDEQNSDEPLKAIPAIKPRADPVPKKQPTKFDRFWIKADATPKHTSGHEYQRQKQQSQEEKTKASPVSSPTIAKTDSQPTSDQEKPLVTSKEPVVKEEEQETDGLHLNLSPSTRFLTKKKDEPEKDPEPLIKEEKFPKGFKRKTLDLSEEQA